MPNQHKPLPPEDVIRAPLIKYYNLSLKDEDIAEHLKTHYDTTQYGCSAASIRRLRKDWGLLKTRAQKHTPDTIRPYVVEIKKKFPNRGISTIRKNLALEYGIRASELTVKKLLKEIEPEAMKQRKGKKFHRTKFYAAGINDCWAQDQHDKWGPRFGLWLHNSIDPFIGFNNWLRVWWTNKNPRLIVKYYLDACRELGGIPMFSQSDPGNENNGVANAQTIMRQMLDLTLVGTLQHRWKTKKNNVKSEANWSVMRGDLAPGLEDLFELCSLVFRWIAIPFVQIQLDLWVQLRNQTKPRADKHKITPHGIPALLRAKPEFYNLHDFKVSVPTEIFDKMEAEFAPPDHEVFQLVPPEFDHWANIYYAEMGQPEVTHDTFWNVYCQLLSYFNRVPDIEAELHIPLSSLNETTERIDDEHINILADQQPLRRVADPRAGASSQMVAGSSQASSASEGAGILYGVAEYGNFPSSDEEGSGGEESSSDDDDGASKASGEDDMD
ncbi:hypothetical protein R3P38DRAFT_2973640 [Favolaschia claudopus]|uniref:Clr5 domain-containing protein n=1 Tax=Favolaschia claudopus TaxID=2862362 RepID=A0AAW0B1J9_9AGAR